MHYKKRPFGKVTEAYLGEELDRISAAYDGLRYIEDDNSGLLIQDKSLVLEKSAGYGIMVDVDDPTYTWRDLEGPLIPKATGAGSPALATWSGTIRQHNYANNDIIDMTYHWPHDWVPGTDVYMHLHWSHNGTDISGSMNVVYRWTFAKGHNQEAFPAETSFTQAITPLTLANTPQYQHRIEEIQLSSSTPTGGQIDTADLEPDGLLILSMRMANIPAITGGSGKPFLHYADIHYQSTNIGTKQKAPDFYT